MELPYLKQQIIPYIGNKRRLLPLILKTIKNLNINYNRGVRFLDLFSGSGIVSRLAKVLGFDVYSNDWEYYSYILNFAYLKIDKDEIPFLYKDFGGIQNILDYLNNLPNPEPEDEFIAKYYAPKNDSAPDYKNERLFYTRYNALIIDKIRNEIEKLYPGESFGDELILKEKYLLLALLLYNAANHSNTSGVFKAFHKGFGGFSKDALNRILKKITLDYPVLINGNGFYEVFRMDANEFVKRYKDLFFDIVYIDPPYNQHQYGSNYHILNTIALWDKEYLKDYLESNTDKKAGIRNDWDKTRSLYCYKDTAFEVFKDLIQSINARYLLISYNTEGIINFEDLILELTKAGKLELFGNEYVKYRGGRQSLNREINNIEFVLVVDKTKKSEQLDILSLKYNILIKRFYLLLKKKYVKKRLLGNFDFYGDNLIFEFNNYKFYLKHNNFYTIKGNGFIEGLENNSYHLKMKYDILSNLIKRLESSVCRGNGEEIDEILRLIEDNSIDGNIVKRLPLLLRKIAHKKYKDLFFLYLNRIEGLKKVHPKIYMQIEKDITKVVDLSYKRFNG